MSGTNQWNWSKVHAVGENTPGGRAREDRRRIKVLLVDDHPLFRAGVRQRLWEYDPELEVVGEAGNSLQPQRMGAVFSPAVRMATGFFWRMSRTWKAGSAKLMSYGAL